MVIKHNIKVGKVIEVQRTLIINLDDNSAALFSCCLSFLEFLDENQI